MPPPPPGASSPSSSLSSSSLVGGGGGCGGEQAPPSWWEAVSQARARILALASILPPGVAPEVAALADSDRPARALLHSAAAYAAVSAALSSGGGADDPACHWLYDTLLSPDPDLRLAALAFLPLLCSLYLLRLPHFPSSLAGFEAVLLAVYSSESKNRLGKPLLVQVPDLSLPSLYHAPAAPCPTPSARSPRRAQPPGAAAAPSVGVLSPPLEPQVAVKSTKRAGIVGVAFEAYYAKIALMPAASKLDVCNAAAAWAGQYCHCRFELDEDEEGVGGGGNVSSLGSLSPTSSSSSSALEEEVARMRIGGTEGGSIAAVAGSNGRHCNGEAEEERRLEARVLLPWELLQPMLRILGHCLLAPLNPKEVRDAASVAVRVVYARACHELMPQAILAARSLIQLDKSARKAAKAAAAGTIVAVSTAGSTVSSSKPNTPSKQKKPQVILVSK